MELVVVYSGQGPSIPLPTNASVSLVRVNGTTVPYTRTVTGVTLLNTPALRDVVLVDFEIAADQAGAGERNSKSLLGKWIPAPTGLFWLRISGTGLVTVDTQSGNGTVISGVAAYPVASASGLVVYPFLGEDVIAFRVNAPPEMTVELVL